MRDGELRNFFKLFCIKHGHACQSSANFGNPYTTPSGTLSPQSETSLRKEMSQNSLYALLKSFLLLCSVEKGRQGAPTSREVTDEVRQVLDFSPPAKPSHLALRLPSALLGKAPQACDRMPTHHL